MERLLQHYREVKRVTISFEGADLEFVERACRALAERARRELDPRCRDRRPRAWIRGLRRAPVAGFDARRRPRAGAPAGRARLTLAVSARRV